MGNLMQVYKKICIGAFLINVFLFLFARKVDLYDLELLSIVNMIFLSFAFLINTNKT